MTMRILLLIIFAFLFSLRTANAYIPYAYFESKDPNNIKLYLPNKDEQPKYTELKDTDGQPLFMNDEDTGDDPFISAEDARKAAIEYQEKRKIYRRNVQMKRIATC